METQATYYDGKTARDRIVKLLFDGKVLSFTGSETDAQTWAADDVGAAEPYSGHGPLRLTHKQRPGERLIIPAGEFARHLAEQMPQLRPASAARGFARIAAWIGGGAAAIAAVAYLVFELAPAHVAVLLPGTFTARMGTDMEKSLVESAKLCGNSDGNLALSKMVASLTEADPKLPPLAIHVYDMALVNAFTLPGGRIVMTRGLIADAKSPDEVAGVLAHEMGHAILLHPEAQLVRILGLDLVMKVFSGGAAGNTAAGFAGLAALLRSSRDAERAADAYARTLMLKANIDPAGLKRFFEALLNRDGGSSGNSGSSALDRIGNVFSTHPGLEERIHEFQPLPAGTAVHPVLDNAQWQALRGICN